MKTMVINAVAISKIVNNFTVLPTGKISPYPTVVNVTMLKYNRSKNLAKKGWL
jgi:hypothetical protein